MCTRSFESKAALNQHIQDHPDTMPNTSMCSVCKLTFTDSLELEKHEIQAGHSSQANGSSKDLNGVLAEQYACDRCSNTFRNHREYSLHRAFPKGPCCDYKQKPKKTPDKQRLGKHLDADKPELSVNEVLVYSSDTPRKPNKDSLYCHDCKNDFTSQAAFDRHFLGCIGQVSHPGNISSARSSENPPVVIQSSKMTLQTVDRNTRKPGLLQEHTYTPGPLTAPGTTLVATTSDPATFVCGINGCQRIYRSEQGLKAHQTDAHSVGGQGLDIHGKGSWMLSQRAREQMKTQGLLQQPSNSCRGSLRGRGRGRQTAPMPIRPAVPHAPVRQPTSQHTSSVNHKLNPLVSAQHAPARTPTSLPAGQNKGGLAEMEQAHMIHEQILRLLIQSDIYIHHDGKITVDDINWTRIGADRQPDVVTMFDQMCHLPKTLQSTEYVPPPKTFKAEYAAQYPVSDFEHSPKHDSAQAGLSVIALFCSKITLADGRREVVRIAAVDIPTCRILISNLVCTDPDAQVADWRTKETGMSSFADMEEARKAGFKIFKGWTAARAALWKFIDSETIIVGHDLRRDLDAMRMIHGRAVDIAKVVEKAAKGPLSTVQLSLESLARNYPGAVLKTNCASGRNVLACAFAVREVGLWILKNPEKLDKDARQKSLDYQSVMGMKG